MGKLRFLFALWMAKLSIPALKITRHNGTDFPGSLAVKLCPDFLKYIGSSVLARPVLLTWDATLRARRASVSSRLSR